MKKDKVKRIWELDFLRSVAIILMFVVHYNFTVSLMGELFNVNPYHPFYKFVSYSSDFYYGDLNTFCQMTCAIMFCLLSGITSSFSKGLKPLFKGIKYFIIAILITVLTYIASKIINSELTIYFGILHMLSLSMILYAALNLLLEKVFKLNLTVKLIIYGIIGLTVILIGVLIDLQSYFMSNNLFAFIGLVSPDFTSADYYPLIPWLGYFFIGTIVGKLIYKNKQSLIPSQSDKKWHAPFTTLGRFSIQFYLSHQIVLVAIFYIIFTIAS